MGPRTTGTVARKWVFAPADRPAAEELARALRISPVTALLLVNRGVRDPLEARAFLQPELVHLVDPMKFSQMPLAVERLERAVRDGERIAIFGDYDVDGTTGTAILAKFLRLLGADPLLRVPHRVTDGYGLSMAAVEELAAAGAKVLVTIDCGTNDHEEIERARELGIDTIILDHHEMPTRTSPAVALVNPKADATYPFKGICSAGIAFKMAWALSQGSFKGRRGERGFQEFLLDAMGYVALGTVADVVPVLGENRVFVSYGLRALGNCRSPGLRALAEKVGLGDKKVDTFDISFKLAPRLNALGRVGSAGHTVELLTSEDAPRIVEVLAMLEAANRNRKEIEQGILEQAMEQLAARPELAEDRVLVLADPRWHVGVVGIVAARLVDRFARPAFVLAVEGGVAKGSGRSVEGFGLHLALEEVRDLLVSGGGHAMAAGAGVKADRLEEFRVRVNAHAERVLAAGLPGPTLAIDDEVKLSDLTRGMVREVLRLEPFGEGNPAPRLVASHLKVAGEPRLMGKKNDHLSFHVTDGTGPGLRAVAFGRADWIDPLRSARTVSLAFRPVINEWRGNESVELHVEDARFE